MVSQPATMPDHHQDLSALQLPGIQYRNSRLLIFTICILWVLFKLYTYALRAKQWLNSQPCLQSTQQENDTEVDQNWRKLKRRQMKMDGSGRRDRSRRYIRAEMDLM